MKRIMRKAAAGALALTLVFGASAANTAAGGFDGVAISASAATTYGSWKQSATPFTPSENPKVTYNYSNGSGTWTLSSDQKKLTLTGTGSTKAFGPLANTDWQQWKGTVETIVVGEGITELNERCFYNFSKLKSVELPSTLTTIGYAAFWGCKSLESITLPKNVNEVHYAAFGNGNTGFEITLSEPDQKIADLDKAFVTDSFGDQTSNLDVIGVTLTDEIINYYLDMFPYAEVGGKIRIIPSMQLSADGSRFTIKGYVPLTTKRTIDNYSVNLGSTTPSLTASGSQGTFTVACAAKEMAETKALNIFYGEKNGFSRPEFSVSNYLNKAIIASTDSSIGESTKTAAKSMLRYGAAAQMYFNYKTESLANIDKDTNVQIKDYELTSLSDIAPVCSNPFSKAAMTRALETLGVKSYFKEYSAINMTFTADTTLMLAFKYNSDVDNVRANEELQAAFREELETGCGVTEDDVTVDTDLTGNYAVLRVKNVPLMKLDTPIFIIGSGDNVVKVCATQYLAQVGNSTSTKVSADLKNLCKALYQFYKDASAVNSGN